jgi:hypothetical protein
MMKLEERMAQVMKGHVSALQALRRLVYSEEGGAAAAILMLWTSIQGNPYISRAN